MDYFTAEEQAALKQMCRKKEFIMNNAKETYSFPMSRNCDIYSFGLIALKMCGISRTALPGKDTM